MTKLSERIEYHAYEHPTLSHFCKTVLCILSFPICCCLCCGCQLGYFGRDGCVRGTYERRKKSRMERMHFDRKSQALERRKSLSIGADTPWWNRLRTKQVSNQATSPLFSKLPREIREIIYGYALTGTGAIYWDLARKRGRKFPKLKAYPCLPTSGAPEKIAFDIRPAKFEGANCAVLRTCRLIYTEALPVLYRSTQFTFSGHASLRAFSKVTPRERLEEIRSIRIDCQDWRNEPFLAGNRFECWKNLRVVYAAYHGDIDFLQNHLELIVEEARSAEGCAFCLLMYEAPTSPKNRHQEHAGPLSYAYVDPKRDWTALEWHEVKDVFV